MEEGEKSDRDPIIEWGDSLYPQIKGVSLSFDDPTKIMYPKINNFRFITHLFLIHYSIILEIDII